jgi:hypothetical protein
MLALVLSPVAFQMWDVMQNYEELRGRIYGGLDAVVDTFAVWGATEDLLRVQLGGLFFLAVALLLVGVPLIVDLPRADRLAVQVLSLSGGAYLVLQVLEGSAPPRTTAFVVVPLILAVAILTGSLLYRPSTTALALRILLTPFVVLVLAFNGWRATDNFTFVPIERWSEITGYIQAAFPERTPVWAPHSWPFVIGYLGDRYPVVAVAPTPEQFASGRVVIVYASEDVVTDHDPTGDVVALRLPQRVGMDMRVEFAPPAPSNVASIDVTGQPGAGSTLVDRDLTTSVEGEAGTPLEVSVDLPAGTVARSMQIVVEDGTFPFPTAVVRFPDGTSEELSSHDIIEATGIITLRLGDREVSGVDLVLTSLSVRQPVAVREIWVAEPR